MSVVTLGTRRCTMLSDIYIFNCRSNNILISTNSCLKYKMECAGTLEEVSSPALIYIPAGSNHRAEPVSGTGIFICIYLDQIAHET